MFSWTRRYSRASPDKAFENIMELSEVDTITKHNVLLSSGPNKYVHSLLDKKKKDAFV